MRLQPNTDKERPELFLLDSQEPPVKTSMDKIDNKNSGDCG